MHGGSPQINDIIPAFTALILSGPTAPKHPQLPTTVPFRAAFNHQKATSR